MPEDRNAELRALFFETANELLQSLNESGLELEARPAAEEIIRSVRRAVHTLKGDSAASGDLLCGLIRQRQYEPQEPLPDVSSTTVASAAPARFDWSEYEQLMISEAIHRGETVFNIALRVDQASGMRAAAFQLIRNVLHGCGTVIALSPEDNIAAASVEVIEASLATKQSLAQIEQRCRIPSIVAQVWGETAGHADSAQHELLGDLLDAHAARVQAAGSETAHH